MNHAAQWPLLLAAGRSHRFGGDKRLALLDGEPLALHAARTALAVFGRLIVVLRAGADPLAARLRDALPEDELRLIGAATADRGMGASLAAGVRALPADASACWVLLADMPLVRVETLRGLAERMDAALPAPVVLQPVHAGRPGHPVGFSAAWFTRLSELDGDSGARALVREAAARERLQRVQVDDPGILLDTDTPAALQALQPSPLTAPDRN